MALLLSGVPSATAEQISRRLRGYPDEAIKVLAHQGIKFEPMSRSDWRGPQGQVGSPGEYVESSKTVRFASYAPLESPQQSKMVRFLKNGFSTAIAGAASILPLGVSLGLHLCGVHGLPDPNTMMMATAAASGATFLVADRLASNYAQREVQAAQEITGLDVFEHELAHALDHAVGRTAEFRDLKPVNEKYLTYYDGRPLDPAATEYSTLRSPRLIELYEACQAKQEGHGFITPYAASHPSEYFADSVKAFVKDESRPAPNRESLKQADPEMYQFVETFFQDKVKKLAQTLA